MIPLADTENAFYKEQKKCYICKEEFRTNEFKYNKVQMSLHWEI